MSEPATYDIIDWDPVNLIITVCGGELVTVRFLKHGDDPPLVIPRDKNAAAFATEQIKAYLEGKQQEFDMPVTLCGTPFQVETWTTFRTIPYGTVTTYSTIAKTIGRWGAGRAVGGAAGRNRVPIVIPCHRVVAENGEGGYTGGLHIKRALLKLEGASLELPPIPTDDVPT